MSMTISTGDDVDEVDDDLDEDRDDDDLDDDDDRPARKAKKPADQDDEADEDDDEDKSPEDLKAEIKRLRASLSKANSSGLRRRQQLKELRSAAKALEDRDDTDDDESDDEGDGKGKAPVKGLDARAVQRRIDKAKKETELRLNEEHKRDLIDTRAESALAKAGVSDKNIRLLKRELDYEEIDFDPKTRRVDGLDEEVDRLRTDYPDFFKSAKSTRRRINGGDDRDTTSKRKSLSATEQQVLKLTGRTR